MDKHPNFDHGQDIRDRTFAFACRIVKFCEQVYATGGVARMMAPQLLNRGTSVAAMLEEARAAESDRDFISKCSIGLKEAREAHVRLRLHETCRIGPTSEAISLREEANALVSIIGTILRNKRASVARSAKRRKRPYVKTIPNS